MVTCSEETCSDDYIFHDMTIPAWDRDTMKYFTPFPECGGYGAGDWYIVGGESQVVGPICKFCLETMEFVADTVEPLLKDTSIYIKDICYVLNMLSQ